MAANELTCPECGSHRILNITLPAAKDNVHPTRGGHRCMDCATQWRAGGAGPAEPPSARGAKVVAVDPLAVGEDDEHAARSNRNHLN